MNKMQLIFHNQQNLNVSEIDDYLLLTDKYHIESVNTDFVMINGKRYHIRKLKKTTDRQLQAANFKEAIQNQALSTFKIEFSGELEDMQQHLFSDYANIISSIIGYCAENNEPAMIIPHWVEKTRESNYKTYAVPHIHLIYLQKNTADMRKFLKHELEKLNRK